MRYMMLVIPRGYESGVPETMPDREMYARMEEFNESMRRANVLESVDGLTPPTEGARVTFAAGRTDVEKGPFPGTRETVGGYWIIRADSLDSAVDWARRAPMTNGDIIEVRRIEDAEEVVPGSTARP